MPFGTVPAIQHAALEQQTGIAVEPREVADWNIARRDLFEANFGVGVEGQRGPRKILDRRLTGYRRVAHAGLTKIVSNLNRVGDHLVGVGIAWNRYGSIDRIGVKTRRVGSPIGGGREPTATAPDGNSCS